jgi:transketolase
MDSNNKINTDYNQTKLIREDLLTLAYQSGEGHLGSCFSIVEILYTLFYKVLNTSINSSNLATKDVFILSKGHAALALYVILSKVGLISNETLNSFASNDSVLGGHPDRLLVSGVQVSTGSLGHGFPVGCGIALSNKLISSKGRIVILVGDGEMNEGSNWESIQFAKQHQLSNLILIIDFNYSTNRSTEVVNLSSIFLAFGWNSIEIDGHNIEEVRKAFNIKSNNKPTAIIALTVKGKGISEMENNNEWHHKSPNIEQLKLFIQELNSL